MRIRTLPLTALPLAALALLTVVRAAPAKKPSLSVGLKNLKIPPASIASVRVNWDMSKPWKDGRLEVRRLVGKDKLKEGVELTCQYQRKKDIGGERAASGRQPMADGGRRLLVRSVRPSPCGASPGTAGPP